MELRKQAADARRLSPEDTEVAQCREVEVEAAGTEAGREQRMTFRA